METGFKSLAYTVQPRFAAGIANGPIPANISPIE